MKRILYNENDEIEISLRYFAGDFYELIWRFKECKKFLWFKMHDKWKCLNRYESFGDNGYRDPRDDLNWHTVKFDLGRESDVQHYESIKAKVKTKRELYDVFNVDQTNEKFHRDMDKYYEYRARVQRHVDELVK